MNETKMAETQAIPTSTAEVLYCTVHPNVETSLRCNKCGRPMCVKCARRTPVGYRCRECVRGQQQIFYNSKTLDPVIQGVVTVVLSTMAAGLAIVIGGRMGFWGWFITFWAGSAAGALIADIAHRAAGRRRSQYSWLVVAGSVVLGALMALPLMLFAGFSIIPWAIYVGTATFAAIGRLRFGR
jgi:hypothetical protein